MIRKGAAVLFFIVLFSVSCKRSKGYHLPPEELAPILADLHLADAYSGIIRDTLRPAVGKNYDSLAVWTRSILGRYHVTQQEFSQSMDWYRDRPLELDSLYAQVIPILEQSRK